LVLVRELGALYAAFTSGQSSPLPELTLQYADYAAWQREWLRAETLEVRLSYWSQQLQGAPRTLELPTDRPRPAVRRYSGASLPVRLSLELTEVVRTLARREGVTPFMVLLAAWQTLLSRYSGQDDISVGSPIAGRGRTELEGLIGFFVNTLVLRTRLGGDPTFRELLARVKETTLGAYAHQDLPFEKLVEELRPERDPSRPPLFQVMLDLQQDPLPELALPGLELRVLEVDRRTAKFDLTLFLTDSARGLTGSLEYDTDLFDGSTAARMLGHLRVLLEGITAHPEHRLSELPLLSDAERRQLLVEWNDTATDLPHHTCFHQLFEAQVAHTPEAVAVEDAGTRLTYRELDVRANQLAHHLRSLGVGPEVRVGLCVERSVEQVVGLLGVLKAGGAYVPLDPAQPADRLRYMLEDAATPVLITVERLAGTLPLKDERLVRLDAEAEALARQSARAPDSGVGPKHLAYVLYTSGSTGRPKGVMVPHGGLSNYLHWAVEFYGLREGNGAPVHSPLVFDLTVTSLLAPLAAGRTVWLLPEKAGAEGLTQALRARTGYSLAKLTPAHWELVRQTLPAAEAEGRVGTLVVGGEALPPTSLGYWREHMRGTRLVNEYGPTETVVGCCVYEVPGHEAPRGPVPIGRPIANTRLYVLDARMRPVPVGVPGELYVGGWGVTRGYLGRPELTAEHFVPNPFGTQPGARLYRTGDLVRHRADGNLEYLGRLDLQVKLRGHRIELGEVEATLAQHPSVREVVVVVREDSPGDKRLVAYLQGEGLESRELRSFLQRKLPEYMVPTAFVVLEALPLTSNGKVDRKALPAPEAERLVEGTLAAPRTPAEELLAGIWARVLGVERVGIHDDFFELGGHSLLATQVVARIRDTFQVEVPLSLLFAAPTVARLAERMEEARARQGVRAAPLCPSDRNGPLPLSFAQQRLWFLDQLEPGGHAYNIPVALHMRGALDVRALQRGFDELVRRHESLRTSFGSEAGQPLQVISPAAPLRLDVVDLTCLPSSEREAEARRLAEVEALAPFDLARGPLLRTTLLRLQSTEHLLLLTMHHIVSDGWSMGLLVREMAALYEAFRAGEPSPLPELTLQYADYAAWQREWLRAEALEAQRSWWLQRMEGAPQALELPTDKPRPAVRSHRGALFRTTFSPRLTGALHTLGRREGATLFMTLLAGFQVLLSRYSGQTDIVVGSDIANRNRSETEGLIGFFVNQLAMRTRLEGNPSFRELLARVRETALGAYAHQEFPFEELVKALNPERDSSRTPIFQVELSVQNAPMPSLELPGLTLRTLESGVVASKVDLSLTFIESGEGLVCACDYRTDLFEAATVERMVGHLKVLLEGAAAEPDKRLSELPLLPEEERRRLLVEWNGTREALAPGCLHEKVEEQAARRPEAVAVVCEEESLTYGKLNRQANQLAHRLRALGVGPEARVGLCVERSARALVGVLGILKAGGAYVPLEPEYPAERKRAVLEDALARVVVTQRALVEGLAGHAGQVVCLDDTAPLARESEANPVHATVPENLAYIIFTSGSTGRPKGVAIEHRQLSNSVESISQRLALPEGASFAAVSTLAADLGHTALYPTLG
ncbi:MAG: amino acid adenylation domain-containing protein, partial [Archangium sp.]